MSDREELRAAAEARLGSVIGGKFRLDRILGAGGMAVVYAATHRNGKRVALKLLHPSLAASERQRKRFLREAYVANTVGHPGVVQVDDDGIDADGTMYLVLELLEGHTLNQLARQQGGKLDAARVLDLADQLLDVLAVAHARGVVHRDLKPDNLFVTARGQLKVLDFGIARMFEQIPGATIDTHHGAMLGTPAYMPQEQARGRWDEVDGRTDLWAVGATMFTLLTGSYVHAAGTSNELLGKAMSTPARSLGQLAPHLSSALIDVVDKALRFEPRDRWPDAKSMQQALREVWDDAVLASRSERESASGLYAVSATQDTLPVETESMAARSRSVLEPPPSRRALGLWLALAVAVGAAFAAKLFNDSSTPSSDAAIDATPSLPSASSVPTPGGAAAGAAPFNASTQPPSAADVTPPTTGTSRAKQPADAGTPPTTTAAPATAASGTPSEGRADRRSPATRTKTKRIAASAMPDPLDIR